MNRFWVWIAGAFALGILASDSWPGPASLAAAGLILLAAALTLLKLQLPYRQQLALAAAFAAIGILFTALHQPQPQLDPLFLWCHNQERADPGSGRNQTPVILEGTVSSANIILENTEYASFILDVDHFTARDEARPLQSRTRVTWENPQHPVYPGQRLRVEGLLKHRLGTFNFGIQGIEPYYHTRAIFTTLRLPDWGNVQILHDGHYSPWRWIGALRHNIAETLRDAVPEPALPFVYTVWLGERSSTNSDAYEKYLLTGTAHILAVSGVHVGIIYASLAILLAAGMRNRKHRALIIIAAVWLFALLAGARVSSMRAAAMISLFLAAELFDREPDSPTALGQAAFLFLFFQPFLLFDIGFLLSYSSVASLIFLSPRIWTLLAAAPWWFRNSIAPVLAVQLLPFPLATAFFNVLPLAGPLLNLAVIPLLSVVLWLCLITTLLGLLIPPAAPILGHAILPVVALIEWLAQSGAELPGAYTRLTAPTPWATALYWLGVLLLAQAVINKRKPRRIAALGACLLILAALTWKPFQLPGVDFLDVGHGDAAFLRTPGGTTLLIDGGDRSEYADYGERVVVPFLFRNGVTRLDYIVMTHPDRDHVGGLLHVLETIPVGMALLPAVPSGRELEQELLDLCAARAVPVQRAAKGDLLHVKGATIEVLWPDPAAAHTDVNNNSLVLRVRWPGLDALFTGDIEDETEQLLAGSDCAAQILKVPHHGSHTSSTEPFLKAINPSVAVVSTAGSGRRAAVHPDVHARYEALGIPLFRTDLSGGVRIRQDHGVLYFQGARKAYGYDLAPAAP